MENQNQNQSQKVRLQKQKEQLRNAKIIRALIAVGLAILLWVTVNGTASDLVTQDFTDIPIAFNNAEKLAEKGLYLVDDRRYYVNLKLRGTDKNLNAIDLSDIHAAVDLSEANEKGSQALTVVLQGLPNSVILSDINPEKITVAIDDIEEKEYAVNVITNGKPEAGKSLLSVKTQEKVRIKGEYHLLSRIDTVEAKVDISGINTDSQQYASVAAYDKDGNQIEGLQFNPYKVFVEITIK